METINLKDDFNSDLLLSDIWSFDRLPEDGYKHVDAPGRLGEKAIELTVHPGDFLRHGPGPEQKRERCEIGEKDDYLVKPDTDIWYGLSFYIPEDFLVVDNRLVIVQWRTSKTTKLHENPPLALRYINDELLFTIKDEDIWITLFKASKPEKGKWHDLLVNYCWNNDHYGRCSVILNGICQGEYKGHLGYNHLEPELQFRFGLYRDHLAQPQSILFGRFRRGLTRDDCEK